MGKTNLEEDEIQELLERYLRFQSTAETSQAHLDEDSLNSFIEGRLSQKESSLVFNHLSRCSFCLHVTAELSRLEHEFADVRAIEPVVPKKPEKISEVLSNLFAKIFGTSDGAVFAHQEDEPKENIKEDKEK
jgi:hypothetical protein